ncbi:MAG TPA: S9 family peptidase [Verrucomicrobiota bacterium]|nr:S9 family peptidase [Verrucomicrobiota bacterium]HNU50678.1 S9 family peptidase [Verrucomicrobiota bacterium]
MNVVSLIGPLALVACTLPALDARAAQETPGNLVAEGIPPVPAELRQDASRYLEFRAAGVADWHPARRELLITTRFAEVNQLHLVKQPGGARRQLTFFAEPVAGGSFQPVQGDFVVFAQDTGGGEFYQFHRLDLADGRVTLLTDGKSRNQGARWDRAGKRFAYTSTRRTGRDTDVWLMDPRDPTSDRLLVELSGGGWSVQDWSPDDARLLLGETISINESRLWLADARTGAKELLTPQRAEKIAWGPARFAADGTSVFVATDHDSEFRRLCRMDLASRRLAPLMKDVAWDVEGFELSHDGRTLAAVINEDGSSRLRLLDARSGRERRPPQLPAGIIGGVNWHRNNRDLAFHLSSAASPADVFSLDVKSGRLECWTESETGGLDPAAFVEPERLRLKSFDGLEFPALVYRPDPKKFPGPRPVLVTIHGGPEGQSRPNFQARNNFYLNEMGVAIVYPNVRGSDGYGKTFLTLDNGFKREDSVKDIGAVLDWIAGQPGFDARRVGVTGGSYGGYMVLACMVHYGDRLRCGVDVVGISNFLTFLKNTQDYRRDLRRVEYGDERDPAMAEFLERISPIARVGEIRKPLFVVQGFNDPRVPVTESEQMVAAIRRQGGTVWYLMAKDEGHGFRKKRNVDFLFHSTVLFLQEHLLQ